MAETKITQKRPLYAISTSVQDDRLINLGLQNHGLLGYIYKSPSADLVALEQYELTFSKGLDFFYTVDVAREKFNRLEPKKLGPVGYVSISAQNNFIKLHRFYDPLNQNHLFVTNPDVKLISSRGFRNESSGHNVFLSNHQINGTVPLFFYANHEPDYFSILDEDSASDSFESTFQENAHVLNEKVTIGEEVHAQITRGLFGKSKIEIGQELRSSLGVEELAGQIAEIISSLKPGAGNMTGVFGSWGRGKTRLMNEIWSHLKPHQLDYSLDFKRIWAWITNPAQRTEFLRVKFHAWRYQDTPASWAYLYEQFSSTYLGDPSHISNVPRFAWRLLRLSFYRYGWLKIAFALMAAVLLLLTGVTIGRWLGEYVSVFTFDLINKDNVEIFGGIIAGLVAIIGMGSTVFRVTKASFIIKHYGIKFSFKETLGIQAEIQKELVCLIRAWATTTRRRKRKIVLFVDDLDRCKDEKLMEIIDALRVILEDEFLKDKLIVVAALDERILSSAIECKYPGVAKAKERIKILVREYIDKLFIFSLKLSPLSSDESKEIFDALTENDVEREPTPSSEVDESGSKVSSIGTNTTTTTKATRTQIRKLDRLTRHEVDLFHQALDQFERATPRKIRILYYRYRFIKNLLVSKQISEDNPYWLTDPYHLLLLRLLITFTLGDPEQPTAQVSMGLKEVKDEVELSFYHDKPLVKKSEYVKLMRIFELVIAY